MGGDRLVIFTPVLSSDAQTGRHRVPWREPEFKPALSGTVMLRLFLLLLLLASMTTSWTYQQVQANPLQRQVPAVGLGGPFVTPMMPTNIDMVSNGTYVNVTLVLRANVTDETGIALVVGSYSNRSDGLWYNVTMYCDADFPDGDVFKANALNYTLYRVSSGVVWDIRLHAKNTLGVWTTVQTSQSVWCLFETASKTSTGTDSAYAYIAAGAAVVVVVFGASLYVKREGLAHL
jgi:hypothetical protein